MKVSGWGRTENDNYSNTLLTANLNVRECTTENEEHSSYQFCASHPWKSDCQGDSGGGGIIDGELCGIVSYGDPNCSVGHDCVYANVRTLMPYIKMGMNMNRPRNVFSIVKLHKGY